MSSRSPEALKVHVYPSFDGEDQGDGGVRRVVEAQTRHLPNEAINLVPAAAEADLIACHISMPATYARLYPRTPLVAHCHGLYWSDFEWANWALKANADVMELLRIADAITAPSEWVAQVIRRHTSRRVTVIPHGIELDEWSPGENQGYVLWNKTRPDPVCDPAPMNAVAELLPDVLFLSTFGQTAQNVVVTDKQPYDKAKVLIRSAGVYLCTAKETFGIGTLEAMNCGVPVVGFAHGGQAEIITHGEDGWLVPPGDYRALADGILWALHDREGIGARAREKAANYTWSRAAAMYADLYHETAGRRAGRPKVSVIVTAYDLERYLPDTLRSIAASTLSDWECLVVDDASPDRCGLIAEDFAQQDSRFRVIHNPRNLYLAGARNVAIAEARGEYILPLDADDMITPHALEVLAGALDKDRTIHIAYGGVLFVNEDGRTPTDYRITGRQPGHSGWPMVFDWETAILGRNYLPYSSMFRREVWEQTGGYRRRCRTAEDADFWMRVSSYGFRPRMVTAEDCLVYRNREGSMSRSVGERQWIRWFPWGAVAALAPAGALTREQMPVPSYDPPLVSVVIPVGPGHEDLVADAVDSVDAQSFRGWECIVVNDSGGPLTALPTWVRVIDTAIEGQPLKKVPAGSHGSGAVGVAAARNLGIRASRSRYFLPLDADDLLEPDAIQWLVTAEEEAGGEEVIYCDYWEDPVRAYPEFGAIPPAGTTLLQDERGKTYWLPEGAFVRFNCPDYDPRKLIQQGNLHPVTALTPRSAWEKVGGYDEGLPGWEDWAFQLALVEAGICSSRLAAPAFTYRKGKGARRESNQLDFDQCKAAILERFGDFWNGRKDIMGCGCGSKPSASAPAPPQATSAAPPAGAVLVQYRGLREGNITYRGSDTGALYTFAKGDRPHWVHAADADIFRRKPDFEVLELPPPESPSEVGPSPTLVAEGPPPRFLPDGGRVPEQRGASDAAQALSSEGSFWGNVAVAERPPAAASPAEVDPELKIRALMELGLTREEAADRLRR